MRSWNLPLNLSDLVNIDVLVPRLLPVALIPSTSMTPKSYGGNACFRLEFGPSVPHLSCLYELL